MNTIDKKTSEVMSANGKLTWKKHKRSKAYMRELNEKSHAAKRRNKAAKKS